LTDPCLRVGVHIAWVPADIAAAELLDMLHTLPSTPAPVFHLVHPRPVSWDALIGHAGTLLALPRVSYDEWLARVKAAETQSADAHVRIPALTLLDFFEHSLVGDTLSTLSTERASAVSGSLCDMKRLDLVQVDRWVNYWQKVGFLD
jgi:hypothetical protein